MRCLVQLESAVVEHCSSGFGRSGEFGCREGG
jgi:hypothetical protein